MDKTRVGFITIGQSPRDDIMPEIKPLLSPNLDVVEHGLLDELDLRQIEALKPDSEETPLVSRLRDGLQVELGETKISKLLPRAIEFMTTASDIKAVGVLCTHEFPKHKFSCPVIFPFDYMTFIIDEILGVKKLGVIVPLEDQIEMTREKWRKERISIVAKSPYTEDKTWEDVANNLIQEEVDAIILDCIGYTIKDREELQSSFSVPSLLPRTILTFAINQLF